MSSNRGSGVAPFFLGALAGGLVGATVALLLAPAEGSETRQGISEKIDDLTGSLTGILHRAKVSAEKVLNDGREESGRIIEEAKTRAEDLIEGADRTIHAAREAATKRRGKAKTSESEDEGESALDPSMNGDGKRTSAKSGE
jgi:gas vesicle protein